MTSAHGGMDLNVNDPNRLANMLMEIPYSMDTSADTKEAWAEIHRQLVRRSLGTRQRSTVGLPTMTTREPLEGEKAA